MKKLIVCCALCIVVSVHAQELYVFSEPASNMPAHSVGILQQIKRVKGITQSEGGTRSTSEVMFGATKNWMLHAAITFSDMYTPFVRAESFRVYGKYRFFSQDALYHHLRMAVFGEASYSRNEKMYDELSIDGDLAGLQAGLIVTQLLHKLAISATGSYLITPYGENDHFGKSTPMPAFSYSLSAGYLLFPLKYTSYEQTNVNLYCELLGQRYFSRSLYYVDLAPALQFIFNSQTKLNLGYRYQINGNMHRMGTQGWLLGMEWLFLRKPKPPVSK
jgi:hypothetical protein